MEQKHKARKTVLSIGITILFVMFIAYAIESVYPSPEYNDFCGSRGYGIVSNESECSAVGGKWIVNEFVGSEFERKPSSQGYCDITYYCQAEYTQTEETYNRNIFFVSLVIGIAVFLAAVFLAVESVSAGFMGGGILLIIYGTLRYWGSLSDIIRTLMIGFALAVLVWVGYKKLAN